MVNIMMKIITVVLSCQLWNRHVNINLWWEKE